MRIFVLLKYKEPGETIKLLRYYVRSISNKREINKTKKIIN